MANLTTLKVRLDETRTYTMRELNQNTARVLDEINKAGQPAVITKHGRFIALVTPLVDFHLESFVLTQGPIAAEVEARATDTDADNLTPDDVLRELEGRSNQAD